ncbi:hypothetical protein SSTU70S_06315 [Stutzerimonas stutzeri]
MNDRIPAQLIETVDASTPIRLMPAQSGGPIHTRSFRGRLRNLRLLGGGLLMLLYFGTVWLNWDGRQAVLWISASGSSTSSARPSGRRISSCSRRS